MYVLGAAFCQQIQIHRIRCLVFSVIEFCDNYISTSLGMKIMSSLITLTNSATQNLKCKFMKCYFFLDQVTMANYLDPKGHIFQAVIVGLAHDQIRNFC